MDTDVIDALYEAHINKKGVAQQLGRSASAIWKLKNREVTLGTKLEVLYTLDLLRLKDGWDTD